MQQQLIRQQSSRSGSVVSGVHRSLSETSGKFVWKKFVHKLHGVDSLSLSADELSPMTLSQVTVASYADDTAILGKLCVW